MRQPVQYVWPIAFGILLGVVLYTQSQPMPATQRALPAAEVRTITPRGDLAEDEKSTVALFERASPSVAYVSSVARVRDRFLMIHEVPQGTGSGFVWDRAGHVVTNFHVVRDAIANNGRIRVRLNGDQLYAAEVVGVAPERDIAVLRVVDAEPDELTPITIGTSADLKVGQKAFAIGNPFGLTKTLTTGVISALDRSIERPDGLPIDGVIQIDAAINPGSSGGPLLDSAGRLIGINTAILSPTGTNAGIGFAVPVDSVVEVVPQLIEFRKHIRPDPGIETFPDETNAAIMAYLGLEGVAIRTVIPGSPADAAGLQGSYTTPRGGLRVGDVITHINGVQVRSAATLKRILSRMNVEDEVELTVFRDGRGVLVRVPLKAD